MVKFLFVRHGKTKSNLERRYVQNPLEPLCREGVLEAEALAASGSLPPVDALVFGEALRCRQTASILFPGIAGNLCKMREVDFGVFKGKNSEDLSGDKDYIEWLETGCMGDIPGGGKVYVFKEQCCSEFERLANASASGTTTALVIHGGNIMAVLEHFALPKRDFYTYHVPNCGFLLCRYENGALYLEERSGKEA